MNLPQYKKIYVFLTVIGEFALNSITYPVFHKNNSLINPNGFASSLQ